MKEKIVGADAFAGSNVIGLPASILDAFDAQFGTDGPDRNSDSIGRKAGCDDCGENVKILAEHRLFVERVIRAFLKTHGAVERIREIVREYHDEAQIEEEGGTNAFAMERRSCYENVLEALDAEFGYATQRLSAASGSVPSEAQKG